MKTSKSSAYFFVIFSFLLNIGFAQTVTMPSGKKYEILSVGPFFSGSDQTEGVLISFKAYAYDLKDKNEIKKSCIELLKAFKPKLNESNADHVIIRAQIPTTYIAGLALNKFHGFIFQKTPNNSWVLVPSDNLPNLYTNELLGFSIKKPENWWFHWVTEDAKRPLRMKKRKALLAELQAIATLKNHLTITKEKEPTDILNPTINISTIFTERKKKEFLTQFYQSIPNFDPIERINAYQIGNLSGYRVKGRFISVFKDKTRVMEADLVIFGEKEEKILVNIFYPSDYPDLGSLEKEINASLLSLKSL